MSRLDVGSGAERDPGPPFRAPRSPAREQPAPMWSTPAAVPAWQDNRIAQCDSFTPPFEVDQLGRFTSELNGETDRGAALVAASRLDEILKNILTSFLRRTKSSDDLLEGVNAPLGTFSARASACHALGLFQTTNSTRSPRCGRSATNSGISGRASISTPSAFATS